MASGFFISRENIELSIGKLNKRAGNKNSRGGFRGPAAYDYCL
jgi:hypothetical protein